MSWKQKLPTADSKPELELRQIINKLYEKYRFNWHSQGGSDFVIWSLALQADGEFHENGTTQRHDRFWEQKALDYGLFPIRFRSRWIHKRPDLVRIILDAYLELEKTIG